MCWTLREAVPCDPVGAMEGRHVVTDALADVLHATGAHARAIDEDLVFEAGLVAAELLSNAARACESEVTVGLVVHHDRIRIAVYDDGRGRPERRDPRPDEERGRGLRIVEALSTSWGTTPGERGKSVWSELPVVTASSSHLSCVN
jgi:signal transduction histidine kinase